MACSKGLGNVGLTRSRSSGESLEADDLERLGAAGCIRRSVGHVGEWEGEHERESRTQSDQSGKTHVCGKMEGALGVQ